MVKSVAPDLTLVPPPPLGVRNMTALLLAVSTLPLAPAPLPAPATARDPVASLFVKVGPNPLVPGRSPGQGRAVVLIHGLALHPFSLDKITHSVLRTWQKSDS